MTRRPTLKGEFAAEVVVAGGGSRAGIATGGEEGTGGEERDVEET